MLWRVRVVVCTGQKRVLLLLRNRKIIVVWERGGKVAALRGAVDCQGRSRGRLLGLAVACR